MDLELLLTPGNCQISLDSAWYDLEYNGSESPGKDGDPMAFLTSYIQHNSTMNFHVVIQLDHSQSQQQSDTTDYEMAHNILSALIIHQSRWQNVHLHLELDVAPGFPCLMLSNMPNLRSLTGAFLLHSPGDHKSAQPHIDVSNSPLLEHLDLLGCYRLHLVKGQQITIETLKSLKLCNSEHHPGVAAAVVEGLTLPSVQRLEFQSVSPIGVNIKPVLLSFIERSIPPLTHLEICGPDSDKDQLMATLDCLPMLRILRISFYQEVAWLLAALSAESTTGHGLLPCQQLRSLWLEGWYLDLSGDCHRFTVDALVDLVHSRYHSYGSFRHAMVNGQYILEVEKATSLEAIKEIKKHMFACMGGRLNNLLVIADEDWGILQHWPPWPLIEEIQPESQDAEEMVNS